MGGESITGLRAVVFDFDGTLAVPTLDFSLMRRCVAEAVAPFARMPEEPKAPLMEELAVLCSGVDEATAGHIRKTAMAAVERVELEAAQRSSLFPCVRPILSALRRSGILSAVVTRNFPAAVYTVFPDAGDFFACVLTRDDVPRIKPDPDHLFRALDIIECPPEAALMVGDHPMDVAVGKAAGTLTAGVASGETPLEALLEAEPDFAARDVGELMHMLRLADW